MDRPSRTNIAQAAWLPIALVVVAACGGPNRASGPVEPATSEAPADAAAAEPQTPCELAAVQRARVAELLAQGKLDRTLRVIAKANALCSDTRRETWAQEVATLAEIGRYGEARALAAEISEYTDATGAAKAASGEALRSVQEMDRSFPDTAEAKAPMRRMYVAAAQAEEAGDHALASERYLEAWSLWHPNGQALYGAGRNAKRAGRRADAQRLFDRAIVELERATGQPLQLDTPNGFDSVHAVAWSTSLIAVADLADVVLVDPVTRRVRLRLQGHAADVTCVAFSPDGRTLASGSADHSIRLWSVATGALLRSFEGHADCVWSVAISPDGRMLASGSADTTVRLWNVATGQLLGTLRGHGARVWSVAFSPKDRMLLASGSDDRTVRLWNVPARGVHRTLRGHRGGVSSVAFSPDGLMIASGSGDKTVRLWRIADGKEAARLRDHFGAVTSLAFSPNGSTLASGSRDVSARLWNVGTGKLLHTLGHASDVWSVAFSPDGKRLASGAADRTVRLWSAVGDLVHTLGAHAVPGGAVALSPEGGELASIGAPDRALRLWDLHGNQLHTLDGHSDVVSFVGFSPDGRRLASTADGSTVGVWTVNAAQLLYAVHGEDFAFSPEARPFGGLLATAESRRIWRSGSSAVLLSRVDTGERLHALEGHDGDVTSMAFSPDGKLLATGSEDNTVRLWRSDTGAVLRTLEDHEGDVTSVAFSPDGKLLASGSNDGVARLWKTATGELLRNLPEPFEVKAVAFSPDGRQLASGGTTNMYSWDASGSAAQEEWLHLWDVETGEIVRPIGRHSRSVVSTSFSPDGNTLVTKSWAESTGKGGSSLWAVNTGKPRLLGGQPGNYRSVAFSRDGRSLAVASDDATIRVWDTATGKELLAVRALRGKRAGYVFTPDGHIDFLGEDAATAREIPICRVGPLSYPFELCEERAHVAGLGWLALARDGSYLDP